MNRSDMYDLLGLTESYSDFGISDVQKLQGDFDQLLRNFEQVKTYDELRAVDRSLQVFAEYLRNLVDKRIVPTMVYNLAQRSPKWAGKSYKVQADPEIDAHAKTLWADPTLHALNALEDVIEKDTPIPLAVRVTRRQEAMLKGRKLRTGTPEAEAFLASDRTAMVKAFHQDRGLWTKTLRWAAGKLWEKLLGYVQWVVAMPKASPLRIPGDDTHETIEGYQITVHHADEQLRYDLAKLREALKVYKKRVARVFPWLASRQIPLIVDYDCEHGIAGFYQYGKYTISVCPRSNRRTPVQEYARTICHEFGHLVWEEFTSKQQRDFWDKAINADLGKLDLVKLRDLWKNVILKGKDNPDAKIGDAVQDLAAYLWHHDDTTLFLQLKCLFRRFKQEPVFRTLQDLDAMIAAGTTTWTVPTNPITSYAATNSEEAFCEALSMLVLYGPRTVPEPVKDWLREILPAVSLRESLHSLIWALQG